jgi:hypothetical protein
MNWLFDIWPPHVSRKSLGLSQLWAAQAHVAIGIAIVLVRV